MGDVLGNRDAQTNCDTENYKIESKAKRTYCAPDQETQRN